MSYPVTDILFLSKSEGHRIRQQGLIHETQHEILGTSAPQISQLVMEWAS